MKYFTLTAALLSAIAIAPAANAQSFSQLIEDIDVTSTLDTTTEYVFRGISLGGSSVQPGTQLSVYGFTVGSWYSAGFGADSAVQADELDLYASYQLPLDGPLQASIGGTAYIYPQGSNPFDGSGDAIATYEVGGTVGLANSFLSPTVSAYYDFTLDNLTFEAGLSHSLDLPREGWSLGLGLTAGYVELDDTLQTTTIDEAFDSYQYGTASISANKAITDKAKFYLSGNFTLNSEDNTLGFDVDNRTPGFNDSSSAFWIGSGISFGF